MNHGWGKKKLGDICEVIGGSTPRTEVKEFWNGDQNWFTPAEIADAKYYSSSERKITNEAVKASGLTLMPPGTVLLTSRAPIGKVGITTEYSYCNQGFKNLICRENLYNEYLYYTLIYFNEEIKAKGRGVTFKEISKKTTENISIPVPPLSVQKQIASELDKINELIEAKRSQLADLDLLAQSLFYEIFGDPITNPKGWESSTIGDIASVQTGATPSREISEYYIGSIPWIKTTEVQNCDIYETEEHISQNALENSNCKLFPLDTIIVAMYGQGKTRGQIARLKIEACTNQACAAILPCSKLHPLFLYAFLRLSYESLRSIAVGCNQKNLNLSLVKNYTIIIPPIQLQNEFAAKIEVIEAQKKCVESTLTDLQTLLASRMDYWFND